MGDAFWGDLGMLWVTGNNCLPLLHLSHVTALPQEPCSVRSDCLGALHNYINCFHFLYTTQALIEEIGHYLPAYPLLHCKRVIRLINIDYLALHGSVRQLPSLQKLAK